MKAATIHCIKYKYLCISHIVTTVYNHTRCMTTSDIFFWTRVARLHHRCTSKRDAVWARSFTTRLRAALLLPRCWQNTTSLSNVVAGNDGKKEQYAYRCKCRGRGRSRWSAKISIACCENLSTSPFETLPAYFSADAYEQRCLFQSGRKPTASTSVTLRCMRFCQKRNHWCFAHCQTFDGTFLEAA
jgi:hypothetical protein